MWDLISRIPGLQHAFLQSTYGRRIVREAQRIEAEAWRLCGQESPAPSEDLLSSLTATARLLEQAQVIAARGSCEVLPVATKPESPPIPHDGPVEAPTSDITDTLMSDTCPVGTPTSPGEPPAHVHDLIRLLDWLALAGSGSIPAGALKHLNRELGRVLSQAGVAPLTTVGAFDPERHLVIDTTPTEDPALVDTVSHTVRAGYLYEQFLLRPQEVILFVSQ